MYPTDQIHTWFQGYTDVENYVKVANFDELKEKDFNLNIHKALNLRHLNLRIQLYIKSKSKVDIGLQCGPNDSVCRYTKSLMIQRQYPLGGNFLDTIEYH